MNGWPRADRRIPLLVHGVSPSLFRPSRISGYRRNSRRSTKGERRADHGRLSRPAKLSRDASRRPGEDRTNGDGSSMGLCLDPVPLTNIAGARFEPATSRIRERSAPGRGVLRGSEKSAGLFERWAYLAWGLEQPFRPQPQISRAPQDFPLLSRIHRLRRARPTGFEPVTFDLA